MKIGFAVNDLTTETFEYTTTTLAYAARKMGHEAWFISIGDFAYDPDENIHAHATRAAHANYANSTEFIKAVQSKQAISEYINISDLDTLLLRNNPADDALTRPWARQAGINFGRFAAKCGVLVLNDPEGLSNASNKLYLQQYPKSVRPRCLITRDREQIEEFARTEGGTIVIKPLFGSGGRNVFLLRPEDAPNAHQMIETVARDGYVIAQEYLPEATRGDTRLFLINGQPLQRDGRIAAIRRVRTGSDSDMRSNITAGAGPAQAIVDDKMLAIVDAVAPRLKHDGMFLVGLDIVGSKLMEINVFSPGGIDSAEHFEHVDFSQAIIQDIERKVNMKRNSQFMMRNRELAVL
jgi:glutathione synthase